MHRDCMFVGLSFKLLWQKPIIMNAGVRGGLEREFSNIY